MPCCQAFPDSRKARDPVTFPNIISSVCEEFTHQAHNRCDGICADSAGMLCTTKPLPRWHRAFSFQPHENNHVACKIAKIDGKAKEMRAYAAVGRWQRTFVPTGTIQFPALPFSGNIRILLRNRVCLHQRGTQLGRPRRHRVQFNLADLISVCRLRLPLAISPLTGPNRTMSAKHLRTCLRV